MITKIAIENFKGIGERVEVELRPLTLLFGPNSAGKSSILHALHYAREIFERQNINPDRTIAGGGFVDLGGFPAFVHNHDLGQEVKISIQLDLRGTGLPDYGHAPWRRPRQTWLRLGSGYELPKSRAGRSDGIHRLV